jgi:aminoglycoside phosphotransferase (APT) family kinase protein
VLDAIAPAPGGRRALVHADLTGAHIFVDEHGKIVALIDFADALIADPRYEWPAIGAFALASDREPIRAALRAYGYAPATVDAALAETLTAFMFLHRFGDLRELPATADASPDTWPDAVRTLFPIG